MDFSLWFRLASFTSVVYNNPLPRQIYPCWQNTTTSLPAKNLNLVWHLKLPQSVPYPSSHNSPRAFSPIQFHTCLLRLTIPRPHRILTQFLTNLDHYIRYSSVAQRYTQNGFNIIMMKILPNELSILPPCVLVYQLKNHHFFFYIWCWMEYSVSRVVRDPSILKDQYVASITYPLAWLPLQNGFSYHYALSRVGAIRRIRGFQEMASRKIPCFQALEKQWFLVFHQPPSLFCKHC